MSGSPPDIVLWSHCGSVFYIFGAAFDKVVLESCLLQENPLMTSVVVVLTVVCFVDLKNLATQYSDSGWISQLLVLSLKFCVLQENYVMRVKKLLKTDDVTAIMCSLIKHWWIHCHHAFTGCIAIKAELGGDSIVLELKWVLWILFMSHSTSVQLLSEVVYLCVLHFQTKRTGY